MFRAILKAASLVCLAVALVSGVLDVTRSIADQQFVMTPLAADWLRLSPESLAATRQIIIDRVHPWLWSPGLETLLRVPTWTAFALLSILLAMGSRGGKRRWQEKFGA